jgi:class 3 adenylate cyclase/tetratricopeptide (TPR) repeat protein
LSRDVSQWLEQLGLAQYGALFAENKVDWDVLPELNEQDFKDLNIPLGHRKKLLKAIAAVTAPETPGDQVPSPVAAPHPNAERRQLTVMFCDLVGSTALSTQLDPEDLREVIRAYQTACGKVIGQYGGYVAKYLGDGVLIYFGYPQAHENDAERAVRAGLDVIAAVGNIDTIEALLGGRPLAVRIGINTGPVVVGDLIGEGAAEQASVVGETPNLAARLQGLAGPNQVVIGPLTKDLIGEIFTLENLGGKRLHGITEPVNAWRVVREHDADPSTEKTATEGPMVGREAELSLLLRSWETSKTGQGQIVLLQGEAGIGKSRLVEAMREKLPAGDYAFALTRCSPYHVNSTLYPVIEHLKRALGWRSDDGDETRLAKLETALQSQSLPLQIAVPLYADLLMLPLPPDRYPPLKLTAHEQREQTLDALAGWMLERAEASPVLHLWEDLNWADATTLELLALIIEQSPTAAILNVLTYRSDFVPPWPMRSHMTPITLNRLDRTEINGLMLQKTGGKAMPNDVIEYVVRKTDGIPLYVEELTKAILESNFVSAAHENYELTRPLSGLSIPTTLQDLLMARLDRLPSIREVAQLGSILGREFGYEMLQAIGSIEEKTLESGLDQLVGAELLYQRGRRPRARYTFKHALVQDAAYHSLLKRTRQFYHRQVAGLLESRYPEIVQTQPELLAHHYSKADDDDKALHYFLTVAEQSAAKSAHAEAVTAIEQARQHAERLPPDRRDREVLTLITRQAHSLHFLGRRQEIVDLLTREHDRMNRVADFALAGEYHFWLGFAHAWLGNRALAIEYLQQSLNEANAAGDQALAGRVHRALATEFVYSGRPLQEAIAHGRQAAALLALTDDGFWLSQALFTLSYCCIFAGDFASALEAATRLREFGDASGIRRAQANAAMLGGLSLAMSGEGDRAVQLCDRALQISPDDFETAFILACLGRAYQEAGDFARAVASLEKAVALADRVRSVQFRAWFRTMLGEAYLMDGKIDQAERVVQDALEASAKIEFTLGIGLARYLLARIARAQGKLSVAKCALQEAVERLGAVGALFDLRRSEVELAAVSQGQLA